MAPDEIKITQALREAVKAGDVERVGALIRASPERLHPITPFGSWLHVAAKAGHCGLARYLVGMGIDVNVQGGTFGGTPLNLAAGYGQLPTVRVLIELGAEFDVSDPLRNPLFSAIQGGHLEIVRVLIKQGIDHRVRYTGESMTDMDALAFAYERGQREIVEYLLTLETGDQALTRSDLT